MASVAITRDGLSSAELRVKAAGIAGAKQARRLLALAMILDGHPRLLAAQAGGMDRQTLRDWVHRYNARGGRRLARCVPQRSSTGAVGRADAGAGGPGPSGAGPEA